MYKDTARYAKRTNVYPPVDRDPAWPRLYQEFATHAARNEQFRAVLAERQRALREQVATIFERWTVGFGVQPAIPTPTSRR